jgi:hypothetical protein
MNSKVEKGYEVAGQRRLDHDGSLANIASRGKYLLPNALAELVDNSIDAHAKNVLIRIEREKGQLHRLLIVDDGDGIKPELFDDAMRFAKSRKYKHGDTGMYGIGMKAASLAMCREMTVLSKTGKNLKVDGRRWTQKNADDQLILDLEQNYMTTRFENVIKTTPWTGQTESGTLVQWDVVTSFEVSRTMKRDQSEVAQDLLLEIERVFGLIYHRFLNESKPRITIHLDVIDIESGEWFDRRTVESINPFGYEISGHPEYPKTMKVIVPGGEGIQVKAHIWPPGMKNKNFKIPRGRGKRNGAAESQGLYFYRNDRLLQAGGWNELQSWEGHKVLARMEVDLPEKSIDGVEIAPDKTGVTLLGPVAEAFGKARSSDGTTFEKWVLQALQANKLQKKESPKLDLPIPTNGLPTAVLAEFENNADTGTYVEIKWRQLSDDRIFRTPTGEGQLILNKKYQRFLVTGPGKGVGSGSLVISLIVLAAKDLLGKRHTANFEILDAATQKILLTAIRNQS